MSARPPALTIAFTLLITIVSLPVVAQSNVPSVNWMQLSTSNAPSGRASAAMAYDPVSNKIVLFGGFGLSGYLNDTWTFDGTTWTKVQTSTAPVVRPPPAMAPARV